MNELLSPIKIFSSQYCRRLHTEQMDLLTQFFVFGGILILIIILYDSLLPNPEIFTKHGIPCLKCYPLVGAWLPLLLKRKTLQEYLLEVCNKYPNDKIVGSFQHKTPVYLIKDPDLVKQFSVKDFEHFTGMKSVKYLINQ